MLLVLNCLRDSILTKYQLLCWCLTIYTPDPQCLLSKNHMAVNTYSVQWRWWGLTTYASNTQFLLNTNDAAGVSMPVTLTWLGSACSGHSLTLHMAATWHRFVMRIVLSAFESLRTRPKLRCEFSICTSGPCSEATQASCYISRHVITFSQYLRSYQEGYRFEAVREINGIHLGKYSQINV